MLSTQLVQEPGQFLNRTDQLKQIEGDFRSSLDDSRHFAIFEVLGIGGAGKTSLLRELRRRAREGPKRHVLWVSLEAEASTTSIGALRVLRRKIDLDCLLFDVALVTYMDAVGQFHGGESSTGFKSLAFKSIEVGGSLAPFPLPITFAANVYRSLSREVKKRFRYEKSEFEAIDSLRFDPASLRERLPHYLGDDISRRLDATERSLIVLYDSYEKQSPTTLFAKAPWLRQFIGALGRGVHVISTRELLDWPEETRVPGLRRVAVDELPEHESRLLLQASLGKLPAAIETRLLSASRRIPLELQAAINDYAVRAGDGGTIDANDLPVSSDSALERLFGHLPLERRRVAVALAAVQVFDSGLYDHLIRELHLPISDLEFREIASSLFVEELTPGMYKTHDLLTDVARRSAADGPLRKAGLDAATHYLIARCEGGWLDRPTEVLPLFRAILDGWCSVEEMETASLEKLVDAGYLLHDAGYWHELASMTTLPALDPEHPVAVVVGFFAGLAARRTTGVERAIAMLGELESGAGLLGRHERSVEVEVAYLSELAGDYAKARTEFEALNRLAVPFDPRDRAQLRSRLYYADMLIMDGHFEEGSRLLLEAYERVDPGASLEWAELVRHRGLALRFSFLLEEAAELYAQAMRVVADVPAMVAKLRTNLGEIYCWHDPERALREADRSSDANARLGNRIELAKCEAIRGIALSRRGEFDEASRRIAESAALAGEVGYPAGVALALQAKAASFAFAGEKSGLAASIAELSQAVTALDTYRHLLVAPAWIAGDDSLFVEAAVDVDWMHPDQLEERLRLYLGP